MALRIGGRLVPESHEIHVEIASRFRTSVDEDWLRGVVSRVLAAEGVSKAGVGVAITGDVAVRDLNRRYRGEDALTDVLSFALRDDAGEFILPPDASPRLGDVVVSFPAARRQAKEAGHSLELELALLLVHGLLHLLGYDHATDDQKRVMWSRQDALLASLGVI
jgi:probable rRNA maturation factor